MIFCIIEQQIQVVECPVWYSEYSPKSKERLYDIVSENPDISFELLCEKVGLNEEKMKSFIQWWELGGKHVFNIIYNRLRNQTIYPLSSQLVIDQKKLFFFFIQ